MSHLQHSTAKPLIVTAESCIYSPDGNDIGPYTREHVVPRALGGGLIIRQAVCKRHQELINSEIETPVLTHWLGPFRHAVDLVSKETRASERRIPIEISRGDAPATPTSIRIQDHPPITLMPVPSHRPGWFDRDNASPVRWSTEPALVVSENPIRPPFSEMTRPKGPHAKLLKIQISNVIPLASFIRFLAKVAHGVAFSQFGFEFNPWLLEIIEGKYLESAGRVIGAPVVAPKTIPDRAETLNFANIALMPSKQGHKIIGVTLNLFANMGGPAYFVLAGYVKKDSFEEWGRRRKIATVTVSTSA